MPPIFDYECKSCNNIEEYLVKINQDATECKQCGSENIVKLPAAPSVRFSGSGFYCTDYKTGRDKRDQLNNQQRGKLYND